MSASPWQSGDEIQRSDGTRCLLGEQLGFGNDGVVFAIAGMPDVAVKLYAEVPDDIQRIVRVLRAKLKDNPLVLAPYGLVYSVDGIVAGFAMLRLGDGDWQSLESIVENKLVGSLEKRARIAQQLATRLVEIHEAGLIIGDLSGRNVRVDLDRQTVAIIDVDSFGWVPTAGDPGRQPSSVTVHNRAPRRAVLDANDDTFTLALHVIHLLLGVHPFTGIPKSGDGDSRQAMIDSGLTWLLEPDAVQLAPRFRGHPGLAALPPAIATLAKLAFGEGVFSAERRPFAAQWRNELAHATYLVEDCGASHQRFRGTQCQECARSGKPVNSPPASESPPFRNRARATRTVPVRPKPRRVEVLGPILGVALLLILIVWWRVDFGSDSPYPKTTTDLSNAQIALVAKLTSTTFKECGASKVAVPKDPIAVVSCAAADGDIERQALVMQFANVTVLNAHLDAHLENFTQTGACKDGKDFAGTWSKDSTRKGRVICSHSGEYHTIEWSLEGANIVTVAQAKDDARLYRWWVANR